MGQSVQDKERLLALVADNRPRLQALGVKRLGLFGSFVRGEQRAESDVVCPYRRLNICATFSMKLITLRFCAPLPVIRITAGNGAPAGGVLSVQAMLMAPFL